MCMAVERCSTKCGAAAVHSGQMSDMTEEMQAL